MTFSDRLYALRGWFFPSILSRYVIREMLGPFAFGLASFTILFFSVETLMGVARMVVESKAGMHLVMEYLVNRLPQVVIFTCPMSVLLSGLLAFGRLSGDSELTAMKAAGIGFVRIAFPGLIFCALISGACLWVNDKVVPRSMKRAFDILIETQKKNPYQKALLTAPRVIPSTGQEQILYADNVDLSKGEMKGIFISYFANNTRVRELYADEAHWDSEGKVWWLTRQREIKFAKEFRVYTKETISNVTYTQLKGEDCPAPPDVLARREFRPEEMSRKELFDALAALPRLESGDEDGYRKRNRYLVMFYQKVALPWTSLIFGCFAIPLGVRPHRSSKSRGVGLSMLFILVYYVLMTVGMIFGETGAIDAQLAAWLPNCVFGALGMVLLFDAGRQ